MFHQLVAGPLASIPSPSDGVLNLGPIPLHMYGLIRPGNEALVPYAIRMMMAITFMREKGAPEKHEAEPVKVAKHDDDKKPVKK